MSDPDATIAALAEALAASQQTVSGLEATLRKQARLIEGLQRQVAELLAKMEPSSAPAPTTAASSAAATPRDDEPSCIVPPSRRKWKKKGKGKPKRAPLPPHLERDVQEIPVPDFPRARETTSPS